MPKVSVCRAGMRPAAGSRALRPVAGARAGRCSTWRGGTRAGSAGIQVREARGFGEVLRLVRSRSAGCRHRLPGVRDEIEVADHARRQAVEVGAWQHVLPAVRDAVAVCRTPPPASDVAADEAQPWRVVGTGARRAAGAAEFKAGISAGGAGKRRRSHSVGSVHFFFAAAPASPSAPRVLLRGSRPA